MPRAIPSSLAGLALTCGLALADPAVHVNYVDGSPQIQLEGSYAGSYYAVWRSESADGSYSLITDSSVLCLGDCFARDLQTTPGRTYFYRFDLISPQGSSVSYGPYAILIPENPIRVRLSPNPSRGIARVTLSLPGSGREASVRSEVRIFDAQGRTVRLLHDGPLSRGSTTLTWDGRGDAGQETGPGLYFLRLSSLLGNHTTRFVRFH